MDVLGGCSKEVEKNIRELVGDCDKCESIMRQMQKAILCLVYYRNFITYLRRSHRKMDSYMNDGFQLTNIFIL